MKPVITGFARAPDSGRGMARDMPVRWALEEVGQPYEVRLLSFGELKEPPHLALHPFGQIPTYEDGEGALFESGAIVLHIAERVPGLLPVPPAARARAISWMFSALSSVEPLVLEREVAIREESQETWHEARLPLLEGRLRRRLVALAMRLGEADWLLEDGFSAGDLLMITVLRRLKSANLLEQIPSLVAYVARGEARPAFRRAFAAQLAVFTAAEAAKEGSTS